MSISLLLACLLHAQAVAPEEVIADEAVPNEAVPNFTGRNISSDQRVVVFGDDIPTRAAVLSQISSLRDEMSLVLGGSGEAAKSREVYPLKNDLIVTLYGEPGDPVPSQLFQIRQLKVEGSSRLRIELDLHLARGLNRELLREVALECLLMDSSLSQEVRDDQEVQVAPWVVTGLLERMAWRNGDADRSLYKALFQNGYMLEMEDLVAERAPERLDAAQRTAFRVSAGALVMTLLSEKSGQQSFHDYLAEQPVDEGEPILLFRKHFFGTSLQESSFAKWWALQLQNLTQDFVTETLTILETEDALTEVLRGEVENEDGIAQSYRLAAYQDILDLEAAPRKILFARMKERLGMLSFRAFPSYQPMLHEYGRILGLLEKEEAGEVAARLAILEEERELFRAVGLRTRDYLDWYQISHATRLSGEFRDFQELKRELETAPTRHAGPLDDYLDGVQAMYDE